MHRFLIAAASLALTFAVVAAPKTALGQTATPSPTPAPTAAPVKTPVGVRSESFVIGDYLNDPTVYNLASEGHSGGPSYDLRAGEEFKVDNLPFMIMFDTHDYDYTHFTDKSGVCPTALGCVTQIGHTGQKYIPAVVERDTDLDGRVGFRIAYPRIYAVFAVLGRESSFNFPGLNGVGLGIEKLPDYERLVSIYFSGYYFPDLEGKFTVYNRTTGSAVIYTLTQHDIRYQAGLMLKPLKASPAFLDLGVIGDGIHAGNADPGSETHMSEYIGLGLFSP